MRHDSVNVVDATPLINGGLYCGAISWACTALTMIVFPPLNGGLHCGLNQIAKMPAHRLGALPPITEGSIAVAATC